MSKLIIKTDNTLIPYFYDYNDRIRYCRRTFNKSYYYYHLKWWGKCKKCYNETTITINNNYYCIHCKQEYIAQVTK